MGQTVWVYDELGECHYDEQSVRVAARRFRETGKFCTYTSSGKPKVVWRASGRDVAVAEYSTELYGVVTVYGGVIFRGDKHPICFRSPSMGRALMDGSIAISEEARSMGEM